MGRDDAQGALVEPAKGRFLGRDFLLLGIQIARVGDLDLGLLSGLFRLQGRDQSFLLRGLRLFERGFSGRDDGAEPIKAARRHEHTDNARNREQRDRCGEKLRP